ncbi:MAG: hypothetical protein ABI721_01795 [Candidatus Dojkabacteria bacterium]
MASLYVTSNNARKVVVVIIAVIVIILLGDTILRVSDAVRQQTTTDRRFYVDPDRALGTIEAPKITGIQLDNTNVPIVQESVHPKFPDVSYVYKIEQPREKLNTFENATKTATALGFSAQGFKDQGNNDFIWSTTDLTRNVEFNKVNQVWSLDTVYENNTNAKKQKSMLQDINGYIGRVPSVLNSLLFSTAVGFQSPKIDARYLVRSGQGDITETQDYKQANYVELNVFRKIAQSDLKPSADQPKLLTGEIKPQATVGVVYKTDPRTGEFSSIVSNDASNLSRDMFQMDFVNFEYGSKGSYFIVTPEEAFSRIQKGQGSLVALSAEGTDYFEPYVKLKVNRFIVDARKTELGFYEPETWTGFVYPIYILTGRAELEDGRLAKFTFYVDAVKRLEN